MNILENPVGKGWVHVLLGLIFASAMVAVTAVEAYFTHPFTASDMLFVVFQNIGLGIANSYYVSKVSVTPSQITETTSKT